MKQAVTKAACVALVVCVVFIPLAAGQFPMACKDNITQGLKTCCPVPDGHHHPCGYPERGVCEDFPEYTNLRYWPVPPEELADERLNWPHAHVDTGCRCKENFYGADCSQCAFGLTGPECDKKQVIIRRNVMEYTAEQKQTFVETLERSKYVPSGLAAYLVEANQFVELSIYDMFQYIHYRTSHQTIGNCRANFRYNSAHAGPNFPTWHRHFMLWMERELRGVSDDPDFALPYWDWIDKTECEPCTNDLVGAKNATDPDSTLEQDSVFSTWATRCSGETPLQCGVCDPTADAGPLIRTLGVSRFNISREPPEANIVRAVLERETYEAFDDTSSPDARAFRGAVENPHDDMHGWIGGTMVNPLTSANDPIFILHHTFIDKLLEVWIRKHGIEKLQDGFPRAHNDAGQLADEPMTPFYPPILNSYFFKSSSDLGYEYDTICLSYQGVAECSPQNTTPLPSTPVPTTQEPIEDDEEDNSTDIDTLRILSITGVAIGVVTFVLLLIMIFVLIIKASSGNKPEDKTNLLYDKGHDNIATISNLDTDKI